MGDIGPSVMSWDDGIIENQVLQVGTEPRFVEKRNDIGGNNPDSDYRKTRGRNIVPKREHGRILLSRIERRFFGQLLPKFSLRIADLCRHLDLSLHNQIALSSIA